MSRLAQIVFGVLLLPVAAVAPQAPKNTMEADVMFSALHANVPVGGCGCFWIAGGIGELAISIWRNFSFVVEGSGQHANMIPGTDVGLGLINGLGGLRLRRPTHVIPAICTSPVRRRSWLRQLLPGSCWETTHVL